jgi:hypothetical protein
VATVQDAGQPLGYLFLDKVFQLSASVPRLTPDVMKEYGRHLLRMKDGAGNAEDSDSVRTKARTRVEALRTEQDLINETERPTGDPVYDRTLREEAVKRLAAAEVENHTKHVLLEFLPLLDPNPRAMKRFVNAYGVQRAVAMLAGINIDRRRLALWTVVSLRWPLLAEYLERRPSMVRQFGSAQLPEDLDPILRPLFRDDDVVATFKGVGAEIGLDESAIIACASLRGPRSPAALEKGAAIS